jgi:anti-sigma B factor antagonist
MAAMGSRLSVPGITVDEQEYDDCVVLAVRGEIDISVSGVLWELLERYVRRGTIVHLDLSEVAFIDSSGLGLLVRAHRLAQQHGGILRIRGGDQLRRVLSITELEGYLELER